MWMRWFAVMMLVAGLAASAQQGAVADQGVPGVLSAVELERIVPATVFFRGQSATVQMRNAGGVRFPDGMLMFAVKVDTGGYSSGIAERYQAYLITEDPLKIGDRTLVPGAYGVGFVAGGFLIMDLGGHTLMTLPSQSDAGLKRPTPLKVVAADEGGFRLYSGRIWIGFTPVLP